MREVVLEMKIMREREENRESERRKGKREKKGKWKKRQKVKGKEEREMKDIIIKKRTEGWKEIKQKKENVEEGRRLIVWSVFRWLINPLKVI